ncbi:MAG: hypothetical protein QF619_10370, partial [Candidatus Binatia bacterium]|nr:hypothetical protein [Candidatus Binatia bacterium]
MVAAIRGRVLNPISVKTIVAGRQDDVVGNLKGFEETLERRNPVDLKTVTGIPGVVNGSCEDTPILNPAMVEVDGPCEPKLMHHATYAEKIMRPRCKVDGDIETADVGSRYETQSWPEVAFNPAPVRQNFPKIVWKTDTEAVGGVFVPHTFIGRFQCVCIDDEITLFP